MNQLKNGMPLSEVLDGVEGFLGTIGLTRNDYELETVPDAEDACIPPDAEIALRVGAVDGAYGIAVGIIRDGDPENVRLLAKGGICDMDVELPGRMGAMAWRWNATVCLHASGFGLSR